MVQLKPGEWLTIKANPVLGTAETRGLVLAVHSWGYTVQAEEDLNTGWYGPVDFNGNVLTYGG